jgi:hypothetical protein
LRILKEPVVHFFVLGLAVFGLHLVFEERPESPPDPYLVEVTSADIEWFRTMWRKRTGRDPQVEEIRGRVNQLIRERVLGREAERLGLDEDDPVLRQRLALKMEYLLRDISTLREPTAEDLAAFLRDRAEDYEIPAQVTFTQIYFNEDERGTSAAAEGAGRLVRELGSRELAPAEAAGLGDPTLQEPLFTEVFLPEVEKTFGNGFAAAVAGLTTGSWQGPVRSGFGLHVVYVKEKWPARMPELMEVKERLRTDWMFAQQQELTTVAYGELRRQYRVLVEGLPYDLDVAE